MNIEGRLEQLMLTKNLTKAQLSKGANIPYTTIDGMFKKGCHNIKLTTLVKLADYFGVSVDYLIGRGSDIPYTLDEIREIESFKQYLLFKRKERIWEEQKDPEKDPSSKPQTAGEAKYHLMAKENL